MPTEQSGYWTTWQAGYNVLSTKKVVWKPESVFRRPLLWGLDYALSSSFSTALGGTGANQPTRSSSTPTMMKEAIRAMPPLLESSMRKSLTTTTAISAAPVIQKGRSLRRLPYTIRMMAVTAHTTERIGVIVLSIDMRRQYDFYNLLIFMKLNNLSFHSDDDNGYCRQYLPVEIKLQLIRPLKFQRVVWKGWIQLRNESY